MAYCQEHIKFLSTLSLRRATASRLAPVISEALFLSTLSLRRATVAYSRLFAWIAYFYPRSPCGERPSKSDTATAFPYFYPRSPCGERPVELTTLVNKLFISIHALLAESDKYHRILLQRSADYFYPRSPCGERRVTVLGIQHRVGISIHALLAESDSMTPSMGAILISFLSTLSLRRATESQQPSERPTTYFYPRSPCGERRYFRVI